MAARARQTRRAAATKATPKPAAQAKAEQQDDEDEDEEPIEATVSKAPESIDDEQESGEDEEADKGPSISLSHEDFRDNPAVVDMASVVDAGVDIDPETGEGRDRPRTRANTRRRNAPEPTAADEYPEKGRVRVTLAGMHDGSQPPYNAQVIVPDGSDEDPDYDGIHDEGETVSLRRGASVTVSVRAARWLAGHPAYIVQRV